jgi:hypothetical protein
MSHYAENITLEHRHALTIKSILGCYFFRQDAWQDRQEATDFAVFTAEPVKVAVRLRRYKFMLEYPHQFTIRWKLASGTPTEIDKIRQGMVGYMFYGFVSEDEGHIVQYTLCDLRIFQAHEPKPCCTKPNRDEDDSWLAAYGFPQFPSAFVLKSWERKQIAP